MQFGRLIEQYRKHVRFNYHGKSEAEIAAELVRALRSAVKTAEENPDLQTRSLLREMRGERNAAVRHLRGLGGFAAQLV